jgi:pimeloyl-ACP methyl ester carboxylesterase
MGESKVRHVLGMALLALMLAMTGAVAAEPGPVGAEATPYRLQEWLIPSPLAGVRMRARLYRPEGDGPFPLALVNHGSDEDTRLRARQVIPDWPELVEFLVRRRYAVLLPLRPGHGATGGTYLESQGSCGKPDYVAAGNGAADSMLAAIAFMREQDFIRPDRTLVIGNSAGGWGALALAARQPKGVSAIVNFAGGRGGRDRGRANNTCAPDRLVAAAGSFGASDRIPTLWLYAENDTYFPPELSRRMVDAFKASGGRAEYHLLGPVRGDGHALIATQGDEAAWKPVLAAFLDTLGKK